MLDCLSGITLANAAPCGHPPSGGGGRGGASGGKGTNSAAGKGVPQKVQDVLQFLKNHKGSPAPNYKGGKDYRNDDGKLPKGKYKEYDVNPKKPGEKRDKERVVVNQDTGEAYYTDDHYDTFTKVE